MKIEDAHEGQRVRVIDEPTSYDDQFYAGQTGTIIQIWGNPEYKWHEWATVDLDDGETEHILWESLEPLEEQAS